MTFQFDKSLYSKTAMLKAAYHFTDEFYVHLDSNESYYIVTLTHKKSEVISLKAEDFQNIILSQMVKEIVTKETKNLRTILMARAMSSSMIGEELTDGNIYSEFPDNAENILKDWFEENG